jgi:exosortase/archaeosortase family protein
LAGLSSSSARSSRPGLRFVVTAGILSVSLFGILRIPFVEQYLLLPFTQAQHGLACRIGGNPDAPISVGLSCSAADVIALCLGFVLAFPVAWLKRLVGAALGLVFIALVNTVRIATLSHAIENRQWFDLLHVYIWPGVLLVVVSVFVFVWMSLSLRDGSKGKPSEESTPILSRPGVRFVLLTLVFVALFVGTSRWWMHSSVVLAVANWVAASGAFVIRILGGQADVTRNVLRTGSGAFIVTQECIMTPLIPAYFAAALALPMATKQRGLMLLASFPVFFALGAARLLVLAFPTRIIGSHLVAIHGFYQIVLAALLIGIAAAVSAAKPLQARRLLRPLTLGMLAGTATAIFAGLTYNRLLFWFVERVRDGLFHVGHGYLDPQGALLIMAPYQLGLFAGLWVAWGNPVPRSRGLLGLAVLVVMQPLVLLLAGEWVAHLGFEPHVAMIRASSVLIVLLIGAWVVNQPRRSVLQTPLSPVESQHG